MEEHGIKYVFPHLCPSESDGTLAPNDPAQTELFLDQFEGIQVTPWIGGVHGLHCSPELPEWRATFVESVAGLFQTHPRLAGVHVNIEPLPNGNNGFLLLLDELREGIPSDKIISVAAYPSPTRWHPFPDIYWDEAYFKQIAERVDQVAPMMCDTAIRFP